MSLATDGPRVHRLASADEYAISRPLAWSKMTALTACGIRGAVLQTVSGTRSQPTDCDVALGSACRIDVSVTGCDARDDRVSVRRPPPTLCKGNECGGTRIGLAASGCLIWACTRWSDPPTAGYSAR